MIHPDFEWPWYQHAPFVAPNGHLFVFDNGEFRNFSNDNAYSRAVEYKIDTENKTVQQIWQYGKERGFETYSRIVSDVDLLPETGNVYFCPGSRVDNSGGNYGAKIIELDYNTKEVVFEMRINYDGIVFHRAERLPLYPSSY
jgi:arylsulfate sulfotransferase